MAMRNVDQPLSLRRPAPQTGHVGLRPGLVDEDQAPGVDKALIGAPSAAVAADVRPVLLARDEKSYGMARPSLRRRRFAGVQEEEEAMANVLETISVLGIDLGKNVCSVVGLDASGAVVLRRRAKRETLLMLAAKLPPCIVAMEACCGAHHLGRVFAAHDHDVRLMSPEYVRPYVKAQKNDDRDAEGIAEAATRPTMRFVELKSQDQLDMQTLHRSRDRLVGERTALINQLRAILLERGLVAPQGKRKLEQFLAVLMDEQGGAGMSPRMVLLIADARAHGRSSIDGSLPSTPSSSAG